MTITYFHPALDAPVTHDLGFADANGDLVFDDNMFPVNPPPCDYDDYIGTGSEVVLDVASGRTVETFGVVPSCFYCEFVYSQDGSSVLTPVCGTSFNGGCL